MALTDADEVKGASRLRRAYNATKGVAGAMAKPFTAAAETLRAPGPALKAAGGAMNATTPFAIGGGAMAAVNAARQQHANDGPAFVPPANQNAPGQIPVDPTLRAPAPVAGQFFNQNEALRQIGNTLNALTGGKMAGAAKVLGGMEALPAASTFVASGAGQAARALGLGSHNANNIALAAKGATQAGAEAAVAANATRAATAAKGLLAGAQGAALADATGAGVTPVGSAPNTGTPNQASYSNEGNNYRTPEAVQSLRPPPFDPSGKIIKTVGADGKVSYGGDNVAFGGNIYSPDGKVVNGGDLKNPKGFGVTSLDTSEGHRQNLLELQRNAAERANAPAPAGAAGFGGAGSTTFGQDLRAKTNAGQTPSGLSPYDAAQLQQQQAQTQQQGELGRAQIAATQTGNNNQLRVAEMNNATQRENNAATTRTAMRGHELDFERGMIPLKMLQQRMATQQKYLDATKGPDGKEQADPAAAHAAMVRDGVGYAAEDLAKGVTTQLDQEKASGSIKTERAARTRALFNGRGGSLIDPDLKDEAKTGALKAAEDAAHSFARQTVKGFDDMYPDEQQALMPKIMGLYELHQKTKNPDHTGNLAWARNLISSQDNSGPANSLREQGFYKGGKVGDRFGALSGALTGGYEKGDVDFNPSGGKNSLRIANPSDNALEVLRRLTQGKDPLGKD